MIVKLLRDHRLKHSETCGELVEVLTRSDYPGAALALARDLKPTQGHYHQTFDEIYLVLEGFINLKISDPARDNTLVQFLSARELAVIPRGVHHQVLAASTRNRLCIISVPAFDPADEHLSAIL